MNVVCPHNESVVGSPADEERAPFEAVPNPIAIHVAAAETAQRSMIPAEEPALTAEELAQRSQAGCPHSFEQLVRMYENHIFNFLRHLIRNAHDAEDLTQETFLKAFRNLRSYRPTLPFAPWLFVIARRTAASHLRSARHFEQLSANTEAADKSPASVLECQDHEKSLWKLVRTLKPKQAEAVWLRYAEGFSIAEISRIMGTNRVHVKVLLHRARTSLARTLVAQGMAPSKSTLPKDTQGLKPTCFKAFL